MKENILSKIWHAIINFFKLLITFIFHLPNLFKTNNKTVVIKKDEDDENNSSTGGSTKVPIDPSSLPDTDNIKSSNDDDSTVDKPILSINNYDFEKSIKEKIIYNIVFDEEELDKIFYEVVEEVTLIKIKRTHKDIKKQIEKLKEDLMPTIIEDIKVNRIENKEKVKKIITIKVEETLKEKPLEKPESKIEDEIYIIATPIKKPLNIKKEEPAPIIKNEPILDDVEPKKAEVIKEESESKPFIVTPVIEEIPKVKLKDEIKTALKTSAMLATGIATELIKETLTPSKEDKEKDKTKAQEGEKPTPNPEVIEEIKEEEKIEEKGKEDFLSPEPLKVEEVKELKKEKVVEKQPEKDLDKEITNIALEIAAVEEVLEKKLIQTPPKEIKKEQDFLGEEKIIIPELVQAPPKKEEEKQKDSKEDINKQEESKEIKLAKEIEKETPVIIPKVISIPVLTQMEREIKQDLETESKKENIEDKDYSPVENKIDSLLDQIENFKLINENKLSEEQLEKLNKEQNKLRTYKDEISDRKEIDINNEKLALEQLVSLEELEGLRKELKKLKLEHQIDLEQNLIKKAEDLDYLTQDRLEYVEKNLIKQKLRKALRILEVPSLIALPFVHNRYFHMFTAGILVNNHFNFLHGILRHRTANIEVPDLNGLMRGKDALENAINMTYENIEYLRFLEQEALNKYPDLMFDSQYMLYINCLKEKLMTNYQKLMQKQNHIDKHIYRTKFHLRRLKKTKQKEAA